MQFRPRHHLSCLIVITLGITPLAHGQSQNSPALSFTKAEAVAFALRNNTSLIAARTTIEQAQARHRQSGRRSNPELMVGYTTDQTFSNEGEYTFEIGFEQRFPVTNRLRLLKNLAKIEIELAETEIVNQERLLTQQVETLILNIAQSLEEQRLREAQIRLNQEFASFV